jgi:hypothetical protein
MPGLELGWRPVAPGPGSGTRRRSPDAHVGGLQVVQRPAEIVQRASVIQALKVGLRGRWLGTTIPVTERNHHTSPDHRFACDGRGSPKDGANTPDCIQISHLFVLADKAVL